MNSIWLIIIAALFSGLIGAILSSFLSSDLYQRHEKPKQKLDTLRRLWGNRFAIAEGQESKAEHAREEFFIALNEAVVVFHDSPSVIDALDKYRENNSMDNLVRLFKAMCKNLEVSYELNDSFFLTPFTPGPMFKDNSK